jgi:hypothetical protein
MNRLQLPSTSAPVPRWRQGLRRPARMLRRFAVASLLVSAACGGRAASSSSLGSDSDPGFLAPCDQSCGDGFECISGLCSQSCDDDTACLDLSSRAVCRNNFFSGEGPPRCEVDCGTDEGCVNALGEGYHCGGAFCRAGGADVAVDTPAMDFAMLELDRAGVVSSACPRGLNERSKLNRELSMLIWSACDGESGSASFGGDQPLDPSQVEQVRSAYANVRVTSSTDCTKDIIVLTLDVEDAYGNTAHYIDASKGACPAGRIHRSPVTGLDELRAVLLGLRGSR